MKAAVHALKYERLHPAARALGLMLAQAIAELAEEAPAEMLVVPVPLHRSKHAERGFNQARLLAEHAISFLRKTHPAWKLVLAPSTLMRLRATQSQAGLTSHARRLNLRGAFTVSDPAAVKSRDILLIDDIMTTGATARAASQAMVQAGAASVRVATLARARRADRAGRGSDFGSGFGSSFQDVEDDIGLSGISPAVTVSNASTYSSDHSSQGQPSF